LDAEKVFGDTYEREIGCGGFHPYAKINPLNLVENEKFFECCGTELCTVKSFRIFDPRAKSHEMASIKYIQGVGS
jgi:hypothetical protein